MFDLALPDQFLYRSSHIFDRHIRIDAVLIEEIDDIGPESLERGLGHLFDVFRATVQDRPATLHPPWIDVGIETELGGDHHPVSQRGKRFTDQFLICERAVDLRRIEEGDAAFHGCPEKRNHLLPVFGRTIRKTHPHAAESQSRNFKSTFA